MTAGVTIVDPESVYIEEDVVIGNDTEIWPGAELKGRTIIGNGCVIGRDTIIEDSTIGDRTDILKSVIKESEVGDDTGSRSVCLSQAEKPCGKQNTEYGDFVEIKNAVFGDGSKASHLAYVGDADVGRDVNVGCGVVFAHSDGAHKFRTEVGDRAFIGSNSRSRGAGAGGRRRVYRGGHYGYRRCAGRRALCRTGQRGHRGRLGRKKGPQQKKADSEEIKDRTNSIQ